ncbi:hypothetical protein HDU93_003950 [Gonapodya sp. JEL0774]|nr:hypothetical protein HDU93_003950 [Gonapodya sp. JEL0774]
MAAEELDYYALLGVSVEAETKDIARAYRKKALLVHPDKVGPDNKEAAEQFLLLTKAYDVLSDPERRAPYDTLHRARLAQKARFEQLDAGRKKLRSDLEAREEEARKKRKQDLDDDLKMKMDIERLREDGLRRLREMEQAKMLAVERARQEVARSAPSPMPSFHFTDADLSLSLRFQPPSSSTPYPPWTQPRLLALLARFGPVAHVAILPPKESKSKSKSRDEDSKDAKDSKKRDKAEKVKALAVFRTVEGVVAAYEALACGTDADMDADSRARSTKAALGPLAGWEARYIDGREPESIAKWKEARAKAKMGTGVAAAGAGDTIGASARTASGGMGIGLTTEDYEARTLAMMMGLAGGGGFGSTGNGGGAGIGGGKDLAVSGNGAHGTSTVLGKRKVGEAEGVEAAGIVGE